MYAAVWFSGKASGLLIVRAKSDFGEAASRLSNAALMPGNQFGRPMPAGQGQPVRPVLRAGPCR
jgi:hypothetical protein